MNAISLISYALIPTVITLILVHAIIKKVDLYSLFVEGAKDGIHTAVKIMPYMIAIFLAIGFFNASGAIGIVERLFRPICEIIGFPTELLSLLFIKPISGSGSLAVVKSIIDLYGADSYVGRCASVMMGSAETIFYTIAIYFGVTAVKNTRYVLAGGFIAYLAGVAASIIVCKYL
ncbi:MAG: spore maturation protein [Clostridia bacterium]|nr:spore maturation protein [Clostridia bacterium]